MMKFVNNHSYRFESEMNAYSACFMQIIMASTVEILTISKILTIDSVEEIIMNFLGFEVIATIDDLFY